MKSVVSAVIHLVTGDAHPPGRVSRILAADPRNVWERLSWMLVWLIPGGAFDRYVLGLPNRAIGMSAVTVVLGYELLHWRAVRACALNKEPRLPVAQLIHGDAAPQESNPQLPRVDFGGDLPDQEWN